MHQRFISHVLLPSLILSIFAYACMGPLQQPVALAHAYVIGSDPVDGSTLSTAPSAVRIFFNAPISPISVAHVYVISAQDGHLIDVGAARSAVTGGDSRELDTPLKMPTELPQGGYEVMWTAVASDDAHTTFGLIGFNIGHSSTGLSGVSILGPSSSNNVQAIQAFNLVGGLAVAWDWLVLIALTLWVAILVIEQFVLSGTEHRADLIDMAIKRAEPLQWLCLAALLVGETVILILRATRITQVLNDGYVDFTILGSLLTQTIYGHLWLLRIVLLLFAFGLLWWTTHTGESIESPEEAQRAPRLAGTNTSTAHTRSGNLRLETTQEQHTTNGHLKEEPAARTPARMLRRYTWIWLLLAGLITFTEALTGDAAQVAQPHMSAILFDWLHLIALCIWFGGLAYLTLVLLPLSQRAGLDYHAETLSVFLRRLSPLMLSSIGVFLISGFYLAEATLSSPQQLFTDPYGRTLLVEAILIVITMLLSAYVLLILRPKFSRQAVLLPVVNAELPARRARQSALEQMERDMRRALCIQSVLGAAVLLSMALMTFYAPPIVFPNISYTNPAPAANSSSNVQTRQVGNLSISLQVLPGRIDTGNTVIVILNDPSGKPVTDAQVRLTINMQIMDMGTTSKEIKNANPLYVTTFRQGEVFSMAGLWNIALTVQRPGQSAISTTFQINVV